MKLGAIDPIKSPKSLVDQQSFLLQLEPHIMGNQTCAQLLFLERKSDSKGAGARKERNEKRERKIKKRGEREKERKKKRERKRERGRERERGKQDINVGLCMLGNFSLLEARVIRGTVPRFENRDAYFPGG